MTNKPTTPLKPTHHCMFCNAVFYPKGGKIALAHTLTYHSFQVCIYTKIIGEYYYGTPIW